MRILQLCKKFPYPLKDGETIAITYLAKALAELGNEVHLLSMNTSKHFFDCAHLPPEFDHYTSFQAIDVDNRIKPLDAFLNLFGKDSYHISRFVQPHFKTALKKVLKQYQFDVVLLETVYLAPYVDLIRKHSKAKIVMRAHNVEHEIWERLSGNAGLLKRLYLSHITPRLRSFEVESLNKYSLMAGITHRDVETFRNLGMQIPAMVLPVGLDTRNYMADQASFDGPVSLGFIGSLDWMPNIEGLKWFLDEVWHPLLRPEFPHLQLHIAGRNTPDWLQTSVDSGLYVHGEVEDAATFIRQHSLMIVPLLSGGGMRVKILESMALSRVNITTSIGLEGIDATHAQHLFIADSPQEFLEAIKLSIKQPNKMRDIGLKAQVFCAAHYDNLKLAAMLVEQIKQLDMKHREAIGALPHA